MDCIERIGLIPSGGAEGADSLGTEFAIHHRIPHIIHCPEWYEYGKRAGMLRNSDIVEDSHAGIVLWDGSSRGTRDTIDKYYKAGKPIIQLIPDGVNVIIDVFDLGLWGRLWQHVEAQEKNLQGNLSTLTNNSPLAKRVKNISASR